MAVEGDGTMKRGQPIDLFAGKLLVTALLAAVTSGVAASPAWAGPAEQAAPASPAPRDGLAPGAPAPGFDVASLVGTVAPLEYAKDGPTVLLFFLASCPHCKHMIPHWNAAYEKRPAGLKVVGVMLDREPPGFFQIVPVAFPVVHAADPREVGRLFRVTKVPMTVRVARGVVEDIGVGPLADARVAELFRK